MERIARKSHEQSAHEIFDQFCDQLINSRSFSLYQHPGSVASNAMDGRPRPSLQFGHLQGRYGIAVGNMALQAAAV